VAGEMMELSRYHSLCTVSEPTGRSSLSDGMNRRMKILFLIKPKADIDRLLVVGKENGGELVD
jgi:hypothetical protein